MPLAFVRAFGRPGSSGAAPAYTYVVRGTPMLVQLLLKYRQRLFEGRIQNLELFQVFSSKKVPSEALYDVTVLSSWEYGGGPADSTATPNDLRRQPAKVAG
ncbi:hypothetical protein [Mesorhizobium sp. B4-1-3]|uniref:hypothetical protein n=1 Tax=Mesorhizobium sp. B4-1-3 TaxID=2589889 RepID=UPI0015E3A334|nr:hypothetical protein [Mesorhizobium sp. B4-1-3]